MLIQIQAKCFGWENPRVLNLYIHVGGQLLVPVLSFLASEATTCTDIERDNSAFN